MPEHKVTKIKLPYKLFIDGEDVGDYTIFEIHQEQDEYWVECGSCGVFLEYRPDVIKFDLNPRRGNEIYLKTEMDTNLSNSPKATEMASKS